MSGRQFFCPRSFLFDMAAKHGSRRRSSNSFLLGLARRQGHCCSVRIASIVAAASRRFVALFVHLLAPSAIFLVWCFICFNTIGVLCFHLHFIRVFCFRFFLFPACYSARSLLPGGRSDYRFASQCNQGGFCWTAFNELLLCKAKFGDDDSKCLARHKNMLSLCPAEWVCAESRAMCLCLSWTCFPQNLHSVMLR
jgi:hypothetical protein